MEERTGGNGVLVVVGLGPPHQTSNHFEKINYYYDRMVRKRCLKALEREIEIQKAVLAVKSNQYKSAAKDLGIPEQTLRRRVNGTHTRIEARQQQQLLSKNQEKTLLKWIKELTSVAMLLATGF
jgi:hypothetical protein